jgi:hypothetical protein
MLLLCETCGTSFSDRPIVLGRERHLHGRKQCLECRPFQPRRSPSFVTPRPAKELRCEACGNLFAAKQLIAGKVRSLYRRRFCLDCSPFGVHNTSRRPPGNLDADTLAAHRRKRRSEKTYRYQKKRRRLLKAQLVTQRGSHCSDCSYSGPAAAFDFHHRDPAAKSFAIGTFSGPWEVLLSEAERCDMLCANCHRLRHAAEDVYSKGGAVVDFRRRTKVRAVDYMGSRCFECERTGPAALFDFHHMDAKDKAFGIGQDGIPRSWDKVVAELEKCVMLCANCHREAHAGVRTIRPTLLGLAEGALPYAA